MVAGTLSDIYDKDQSKTINDACQDECCGDKGNIVKRAFNYGFKTLPKDIAEIGFLSLSL